jgi:hypothetical protein
MSAALDQAIFKRLSGGENLSAYPDAAAAQVALATFVPVDPQTTKMAAYEGNWNPNVQMPCITFRVSAGKPDGKRWRSSGAMADVFYDFEFWDGPDITRKDGKRADGSVPDGSRISRIHRQVELLLNQQCAKNDNGLFTPLLPLSAGRVFDHQTFVELQHLFFQDSKGGLHYGLWRLWIKEARY